MDLRELHDHYKAVKDAELKGLLKGFVAGAAIAIALVYFFSL